MSLIDNIFTNRDYYQNDIHINDITDHFPISLSIKNMFSKVNDTTNNLNYYRTIDKNNITNLIDKLKFTDWKFIYSIEDIELACSTLLSYLTEIYHSFYLVKKIQSSNSKNKFPWVGKSIKKEILNKNKLYNTFISNSCQENKYAYRL